MIPRRRVLWFLAVIGVSIPVIGYANSEKDSMLKEQLIQMHYIRAEAYRQDLANCLANIKIDITKPLGKQGSPGITGGAQVSAEMMAPCKKLRERYEAEIEYGRFVLGL